jgi:hypothetical protein
MQMQRASTFILEPDYRGASFFLLTAEFDNKIQFTMAPKLVNQRLLGEAGTRRPRQSSSSVDSYSSSLPESSRASSFPESESDVVWTPCTPPRRCSPRQPGIRAPTDVPPALLALWFAENGIPQQAVEEFGQLFEATEVGDYSWVSLVQDEASRSAQQVKRELGAAPYVCVAFEDGRYQHNCKHVLVAIAHTERGSYVLPPTTHPEALARGTIATALNKHLYPTLQAGKLKHAIVRGASSHTGAVATMNVVAEAFLAAYEDRVRVSGLLKPDSPRVLAEVNTALQSDKYAQSFHLLCIGEWVRNCVLEAGKGPGAEAERLLQLIAASLHSSNSIDAGRCELTDFIREKREATSHELDTLLAQCELIGKARVTRYARASLAAQLVQWKYAKQDDARLVALRDDPDGDDSPSWRAALTYYRSLLEVVKGRFACTSTAASIQTLKLWRMPALMSYGFARNNLALLRAFFDKERYENTEGHSDEASSRIGELLPWAIKGDPPELVEASNEAFAKIFCQLDQYVTSMAPVAKFLCRISDGKPNAAFNLWPEIHVLCESLMGKPAGSVGKALGDILHPLLRFPLDQPSRESEALLRRTVKFFFYAHLFVPGALRALEGEPWVTYCFANDGFSAAVVRAALNFTPEELPDGEWLRYHKWSAGAMIETDPAFYWRSGDGGRYKRLQRIALYLLNMQCVATARDSVIGVMRQMAISGQLRVHAADDDDQETGELVAFRCNGDVTGEFGGQMHSGWMNRNALLS